MSRELALFDLDGTLTAADTLVSFCRYACGRRRWLSGLAVVAPALVWARLTGGDTGPVKERLFRRLFAGREAAEVELLAQRWAEDIGLKMLRPGASDEIARLRDSGARVVIVTASLDIWVRPLARLLGVELIATEAEVADGRLTGRFATPNCRGRQKVKRLTAYLRLSDYTHISAYGDSPSDRPMLSIAQTVWYRGRCEKCPAGRFCSGL